MLADWMLHVNVTRKAEEVYHGLGGFRGGSCVTLQGKGLAGLVIHNTCNQIVLLWCDKNRKGCVRNIFQHAWSDCNSHAY